MPCKTQCLKSLKIARRFFLVGSKSETWKNHGKNPWHIWWFDENHGWWWRSSCLNGRCGSFRWRVGGLREANHERSAGAKQSSKDQRLGRYLDKRIHWIRTWIERLHGSNVLAHFGPFRFMGYKTPLGQQAFWTCLFYVAAWFLFGPFMFGDKSASAPRKGLGTPCWHAASNLWIASCLILWLNSAQNEAKDVKSILELCGPFAEKPATAA